MAELGRAVRSGTGLGVLYADVNGLKKINDELGHAVGSAALVELAAILRGTFRASDIIGRVGGDEFVVLFAAPDDRALAGARARLDDALAASSAQRPNRLSVSVGMLRWTPIASRGATCQGCSRN